MGQWFNAIMWKEDLNKDSIDASPSEGYKMMEIAWTGTEYVKDVMNVLGEKGPLHFLTVGDYAWDDEEGPDTEKLKELGFSSDPYDFKAQTSLKNIEKKGEKYWRYLVNETKKEYVDLTGSKLPLCWISSKVGSGTPKKGDRLHPLLILTAVGNGQGGGDYIGTSDWLVGSWAGDLIGASISKPGTEYTEIRPEFTTSAWKCFDSDKQIRENINWFVSPDRFFPDLEWTTVSVEEYLKKTGRVPENEERLKGFPESTVKRFLESFPDATADEIKAVNANFSARCWLEPIVKLGLLEPLVAEFGGLKELFDEHNFIRVFYAAECGPDPMEGLLGNRAVYHGLGNLAEEGRWDEVREELKKKGVFCYDLPDGEVVVENERR